MNIFNKPVLLILGVCAILSMLAIGAKISSLIATNEILKKSNEDLGKKADELKIDNATLKANLTSCDATLAMQNQAIKATSVKIKQAASKDAERIKKIYVKDESCEAELSAYKELFK